MSSASLASSAAGVLPQRAPAPAGMVTRMLSVPFAVPSGASTDSFVDTLATHEHIVEAARLLRCVKLY
jgi:hypothetical protein